MAIRMCRVNANHSLVLDTNTDSSHLVRDDRPADYLFTFDSGGYGRDTSGNVICRAVMEKGSIVIRNDFGITTVPVSTSKYECYFTAEADFLAQWLKIASDNPQNYAFMVDECASAISPETMDVIVVLGLISDEDADATLELGDRFAKLVPGVLEQDVCGSMFISAFDVETTRQKLLAAGFKDTIDEAVA